MLTFFGSVVDSKVFGFWSHFISSVFDLIQVTCSYLHVCNVIKLIIYVKFVLAKTNYIISVYKTSTMRFKYLSQVTWLSLFLLIKYLI